MTILQMPVRQLGLMVNSSRAPRPAARGCSNCSTRTRHRDAPAPRTWSITDGVLRFDECRLPL
jgi:ATP-binding cassette subfamily B protein